ncbi:aspartate aminotransferase [Oceanicola granulosus HTCC2516]|uniref:aspartate transaminase n=1 Tax=Oceanicola granulosus (strain ATCC BAA-861 / DSM 15982 / KCTC 12143 / HTCC2516) TaxID=314256 RepID=Q2CEF0_OCEGH|nr:aminotransferase class I/II-fold pyridoxal phosphate-dependent enzyme [Oceanicola granulosus]EAR51047.1 aspartate aminotransferase [Oceanicola granulosus HTCC2516]
MNRNHSFAPAERVRALELPERADIAPPSVRQADLDILGQLPPDFLDTTHFDTVAFPPPDYARQMFDAAAADGSLAYTGYRGHPGVLAEVARNVSAFLGVEVDPRRNIALLPGTQAALFATLSARVNRGDRIVLMDPDYLFTARILRFLEAEIAYVPLVLTDGRYEPDIDEMARHFADPATKLAVFSHPNNPTGAVYRPEIIARIAELAAEHDVGLVADELYARLVYDGTPFPHIAAEPGAWERTCTLLGPSKTESLSGYRLGVVVGPAPIMEAIENTLSITSLRAPAYAQHVLRGWLGPDRDWLERRLAAFAELRRTTLSILREVPWLKVHPQHGTAYLWADLRSTGLSDIEIGRTLARDAATLISPGYQFGPNSSGHIRICYARDPATWPDDLRRMIDVLERARTRR